MGGARRAWALRGGLGSQNAPAGGARIIHVANAITGLERWAPGTNNRPWKPNQPEPTSRRFKLVNNYGLKPT